jgi:hypothetical protein
MPAHSKYGLGVLDGDDEVLAVGSQDFEEFVWIAGELLVDQRLTGLIKDADVHAACMEIDSAVVTVLLGVESHRGLLSLRPTQPTAGWERRGPQTVSRACSGQPAAPSAR